MRRIAIAVVVLVLTGTVSVLWIHTRMRQQAPSARPTTGAPAGARTAAPLAADLMLQVNGAPYIDVAAGEPLILTVSLLGTASEPAYGLDAHGKPWSSDLRFETLEGKPLPSRIDQLGPPAAYRFDRRGRKAAAKAPEATDDTRVDDLHVHQAQFAVAPDEAERLTAGSYRIHTILTLPPNVSGGTQLVSNTIAITVRPGSPAEPDKRRRVSLARFYLRSEKWDEAHRIALELVGGEGADAEAYILLADALNGLRRDEEALAAYHEAMNSLPPPKESPDYLNARMAEVQQRLEAAKGKKE